MKTFLEFLDESGYMPDMGRAWTQTFGVGSPEPAEEHPDPKLNQALKRLHRQSYNMRRSDKKEMDRIADITRQRDEAGMHDLTPNNFMIWKNEYEKLSSDPEFDRMSEQEKDQYIRQRLRLPSENY